jgi:hypothetical protein
MDTLLLIFWSKRSPVYKRLCGPVHCGRPSSCDSYASLRGYARSTLVNQPVYPRAAAPWKRLERCDTRRVPARRLPTEV